MPLRFSWRYATALFALTLVLGEMHEQAHIQLGRIVCGCYGERDFSLWETCASCASPALAPLASLAGPLLTYAVIWTGALLLTSATTPARMAVGLSLVFAPLPFARIFTALMGRGDEATFLRTVVSGAWEPTTVAVVAAGVVLLACAPPIVMAWMRMAGRGRLLWAIGLCLLPMLAQGAYVRLVLNRLLSAGYLAEPVLFGTPALVGAHTVAMGILLALVAKWLLLVTRDAAVPPN